MKTCTLLLCLLPVLARAYRHDIYLKTVPHKQYRFDLLLLDPADSALITIHHCSGGDMGLIPHTRYSLDHHLPDGTYCIFTDSLLTESQTFKNGQPDSVWVARGGSKNELTLTSFNQGNKEGLQAVYDSNGHIHRFEWVAEHHQPVHTYYYPSGKVRQHYYNLGTAVELSQVFDEEGYIKTIRQTTFNHCSDTKMDVITNYENGKLNGVSRIELRTGVFEIEYQDNEILWWTLKRYVYPEKLDHTERAKVIHYTRPDNYQALKHCSIK